MNTITVQRKQQVNGATIGVMTIPGTGNCYTLEDKHNEKKVWGETRIPAGKYRLQFRKEGRFHAIYRDRFPDMHLGMIEIVGIPGYKWVLIHCGNTKEDTAGCILVGERVDTKAGTITSGSSTIAYKRIYPVIATLMKQDPTYIEIFDEVTK